MVTLVLNEQAGMVHCAGQMHADLSATLVPGSSVTIDIADLGEVDLSFLQTVEAARRHASASGVDVVLSEPAGKRLREALDRSGLSAAFTSADRSFWLHES